MRECAQRHLRSIRRRHVDILQRIRALAEHRIDLHHHVILVDPRIHRGHLPLPKRVVKHVVDHLRR